MYERLNEAVTQALAGAPIIALGASFIWGILSVILSPCHLASIPLIVGFISGQGKTSARRAFGLSSLFALGILVTIALIGAITAGARRMMGDLGPYPYYLVAVVFFLVGLHLLEVIPMPWSGPKGVRMQRKGFFAALVLGLVFGLALGPCTFGFMAPVLTVTILNPGANALYSVLLLLAYGIGHCSVIVLAGTSTELVQRYLNWNETTGAASTLRKVCGLLVILGGLYLIYRAPVLQSAIR